MNNNISNITLFLSAVIFLFASAFTIETSTIEIDSVSSCYTCTLSGSGVPQDCTGASFCGMDFCEPNGCVLSGELCGECACEDPTVPCEG